MKRSKPYIDRHPDEPSEEELSVSDLLDAVNSCELSDDEQWLALVVDEIQAYGNSEIQLSSESLARAIYSRIAR
jgi:hypothetical protein